MSILDFLLLPFTLLENYRENMEDKLGIKYLYKCIIISNILIVIFSIIISNHSIAFFYSLGTLFLILSILKSSPNEMHERAFTRLWKKYKDIDSDAIKDKILTSKNSMKEFIVTSKKRVSIKGEHYYDEEDIIINDDELCQEDVNDSIRSSEDKTTQEDLYNL